MANIRALLEPIADWFNSFGLPEPIVHWGHPLMMGIVVVAMGSAVGWAGWQGKLATEEDTATKNKAQHRKIAPWMFLFIATGYTGGVLSLVMQNQPILESPHFWTGSLALLLLGSNGLISATGFLGNKPTWRNVHAYVGSAALILLVIHGVLGIKLGLAI